ncbi:MAG TPA: FHA domain-containing protein [Solirubrobacteraceae bacterium]|nr:FHA domain-containing protein [Solirubrobacteraceae bacterium]
MAPASAVLEVVAGKAVGMSIVVEDELVIGRNAEGAGKLAEDGELSRSHARIALEGNGFCAIEDLGSTNGTFVNGLRISVPQTLSEGDTIELGATTLVARSLPTVKAQTTARPAPPASPAAPAPQAAAAPDMPAPPALAKLSLQLEVDFAAREARLLVDDLAEPVRLVYDEGVWRSAPSAPTE